MKTRSKSFSENQNIHKLERNEKNIFDYLNQIKKNERIKKYIILGSFLLSFLLLFINIFFGILLLTFSFLLTLGLILVFDEEDYDNLNTKNKINNKFINEFKNLISNKNFRNNQNYIIDKIYIRRKFKYTFYPIDSLENKYTYFLFFKIIFGFILLIITIIIGSKFNMSIDYLLGGIFIVILLHIIYNIYLFFRKTSYFYPRRKKYYTILKYSPIFKNFKFFRKLQ